MTFALSLSPILLNNLAFDAFEAIQTIKQLCNKAIYAIQNSFTLVLFYRGWLFLNEVLHVMYLSSKSSRKVPSSVQNLASQYFDYSER